MIEKLEKYNSGIYKITSPSGKIYIGQTTNWKKRVSYYRIMTRNSQPKLYFSIKKYGFEKHNIECLAICKDKENLNTLEKYYIKFYDSKNSGLNCTDGGEGTVGCKSSRKGIDSRKEIFCQYCNKLFKTYKNSNFCSKSCAAKNRPKILGRIPWNKGKKIEHSEQYYESMKKRKEKTNQKWIRKCECCGKLFRAARTIRKFCSYTCSSQYRKKQGM